MDESKQCSSGEKLLRRLYEASRIVRHDMGTERIRELEEEVAIVRAKLAQLEAQVEKAEDSEKRRCNRLRQNSMIDARRSESWR